MTHAQITTSTSRNLRGAVLTATLVLCGCQATHETRSDLVAQLEHDQRAQLFRACSAKTMGQGPPSPLLIRLAEHHTCRAR